MPLNDKVILLTGGGRGIGKTTAEKLLSEGAVVVLISRTEKELKETVSSLDTPKAEYRVCDVSDYDSVLRTVSEIGEKYGRIDILINNAGVQAPIGRFDTNDIAEWKKNIDINLFGTAQCIHAVLPYMKKASKGKIINMSGGGSTSPRQNFSAYAVAKTGVVRLTENLACELKEFNIDINAVAPGAVNTKMLDEVIDSGNAAGNEYTEAQNRKIKGGTDPEVPASLICFLASDLSDGITGKLISAPWDKWNDAEFINELKQNADLGTLRRIDNKTFFKKL